MTIRKSDAQIQEDVMEELKWDPAITHEHIGVSVKSGVCTLSGTVPSFAEKSAAEEAARRVSGVLAVLDKLEIRIPGMSQRDDQDIAEAILNLFKWNVQIPDERLKISVSNGWVTLMGEVEWEFQKSAAENATKSLTGVKGITNEISIRSRIQPFDIKQKIEQALKRAVERETGRIEVTVLGGKVILRGKVRSFADLRDIKGAAWNAPGVTEVEDHLTIAA